MRIGNNRIADRSSEPVSVLHRPVRNGQNNASLAVCPQSEDFGHEIGYLARREIDHGQNLFPDEIPAGIMRSDLGRRFLHAYLRAEVYPELIGRLPGLFERLRFQYGSRAYIKSHEIIEFCHAGAMEAEHVESADA